MDKKYNVYRIKIGNFEPSELLASDVDADTVEAWETSSDAMSTSHFTAGYEVGSPADLEMKQKIYERLS